MSKIEFYSSLSDSQKEFLEFLLDEAYANGIDEGIMTQNNRYERN